MKCQRCRMWTARYWVGNEQRCTTCIEPHERANVVRIAQPVVDPELKRIANLM